MKYVTNPKTIPWIRAIICTPGRDIEMFYCCFCYHEITSCYHKILSHSHMLANRYNQIICHFNNLVSRGNGILSSEVVRMR